MLVLDSAGAALDDWRIGDTLVGVQNGSNTVFTTSTDFVHLQAQPLSISVYLGGARLTEGCEYSVSESGGAGTGYDTVTFTAFAPDAKDIIRVTYLADS